jgi:hypothetical protein
MARCTCRRVLVRGVPLSMSRIHSACPDSDRPDRSVATDVLLRQVPDEEEDEETKRKTKAKKMTTVTTATRSERALIYFSG